MERKSKPRVLQKSIRYPTYQLTATAGSGKETPEKQLVICALSVLEWIRAKFQEFDIPEEFRALPPERYGEVSLDQLKTVHIDAGYTVETVCLPEEKIWAFRLTEPDLSTSWDGEKEVSTAVPGRIFETNLAFRVAKAALRCGVNVIVSEPENAAAPCRVLRPAVVQTLAENPLVALSSGRPLEKRLWELNGRDQLKSLRNDLQTGILPAVIFCDYTRRRTAESQPSAPPPPDIAQMFAKPVPGNRLLMYLEEISELPREQRGEDASVPYDTDLFASARMAYVHSFHLPWDQFENFRRLFQIEPQNGGVIFMEPQDLGGGYRLFPYRAEGEKETFDSLMRESRDYLRKKSVKYENVVFLTEAKLLHNKQLKKARRSMADTVRMYEEQQELLKSQYEDKLMKKNERIEQQAEKITRLKNQLAEADLEMEEVRQEAAEKVAQAECRMEAMQGRLEYLESLSRRPRTPQEIPAWVQERFSGRLLLHARAVKKLESVPPNDMDMQLLCDALEYLAQEYRDQRAGRISRDEANQRSSEKYGRPFEVKPCGSTTIEMYPGDYKIKYKAGAKGDPVETPLTDHLKVGRSGGNLIRIYFLYDEEKQLIVVGSLPYHLKVAQIQG